MSTGETRVAWEKANPEKRREIARRYREKNRERRNAEKREWAKRNKDRVREYQKLWNAKQDPGFWHRWPSSKPQKDRKPGRSYAEDLKASSDGRRRITQELGDSYLRGWMTRRSGFTIKPKDWPAEQVAELRRNVRVWRTKHLFKALSVGAILNR